MVKLAVVTGANQGIGYYIVKALLLQGGFKVQMMCRRTDAANEAISKLKAEVPTADAGLLLKPIELRLDDDASISSAVSHMSEKLGEGETIDVLINNAGVLFSEESAPEMSLYERAEKTVKVNTIGTLQLTEGLLPLMSRGGRIIMVSSRMGAFNAAATSEALRTKLASLDGSPDEAIRLTADYLQKSAANTAQEAGWVVDGKSAYCVSKALLNMWVRLVTVASGGSGSGSSAYKEKRIKIISCSPGWCQTRMTGQKGHKTAEEGADTPAWLTWEADNLIKAGGFYADRKLIRYADGEDE